MLIISKFFWEFQNHGMKYGWTLFNSHYTHTHIKCVQHVVQMSCSPSYSIRPIDVLVCWMNNKMFFWPNHQYESIQWLLVSIEVISMDFLVNWCFIIKVMHAYYIYFSLCSLFKEMRDSSRSMDAYWCRWAIHGNNTIDKEITNLFISSLLMHWEHGYILYIINMRLGLLLCVYYKFNSFYPLICLAEGVRVRSNKSWEMSDNNQ